MPGLYTASFVRPADTTAYASGDLIANSTTAGSVVLLNFGSVDGVIEGGRIRKTSNTTANTAFRMWLYQLPLSVDLTALTVANGDNGALSLSTLANFLGRMSCAAMETHASLTQAWGPLSCDDALRYVCNGQRLIGALEARAAYAPASAETFEVTFVTA